MQPTTRPGARTERGQAAPKHRVDSFGPGSSYMHECRDVAQYYAGISASPNLKSTLHERTKGHTVVSYANLWGALAILDADPSDASRVVGIYSGQSYGAEDRIGPGRTTGWNREHSWPKSFGLGTMGPDYSDLHALFAASGTVNSERGNLYFDSCSSGCTSPVNGCTTGSECPTTAKDSVRFQPPADKRGDLARAMFYMAVRYNGDEADTEDLELSDTPSAELFRMGKLSTLLQWHAADPVSDAERARNGRICTDYQSNRNPFVDKPEWVSCIFEGGDGTCAGGGAPTSPSLPSPPSPPVPGYPGGLVAIGVVACISSLVLVVWTTLTPQSGRDLPREVTMTQTGV